jgi:mono/diheme cytochrome c family protein
MSLLRDAEPGRQHLERIDVAEIPEHLLARSKARRAAVSGEGGGDAATPAAASPAAASASATPATTSAAPSASAKAAAAAAVPVSAPKPPVVKGLVFAKMSRVALMAGVPLWAFFYAGVFAVPASTTETPAQIGASIFSSQCATCHLANGAGKEGGGVGRPLWNGMAEMTFPKLEQQLAFVRHGSCEKGVPYGNPKRADGEHVALGGMPAFPDLTAEQIQYVLEYERTELSGKPFPVPVLPAVEKTKEELETEQAKISAKTADVCGPGRKGY